MPRKQTYEERMAKALREKEAAEAKLKKIADAREKADLTRLRGIARRTGLLDIEDAVLIPALADLVKSMKTQASQKLEPAHA